MNKVMLIGNVGQDPEIRYVEQGVAVARLRLATTERGYTLQNGTQVPDHTDWHNVILWRKLAEVVEKYVHKGDKLYIEGRIRYTTYDDKQGQRRFMTEIWADNMEMLSPKAMTPASAQEPAVNAPVGAAQPQGVAEDEPREELPFSFPEMDYFQELFNEVTIMAPSAGAIFAIVLAAVLLLFSGFASGSEIAFFSLTPNDINELEESNSDKDKRILDQYPCCPKFPASILVSLQKAISPTTKSFVTFLSLSLALK